MEKFELLNIITLICSGTSLGIFIFGLILSLNLLSSFDLPRILVIIYFIVILT